jgi:cell division topological specificity factor
MSFLDFFLGEKKKTASVAKERLQIILAHERGTRSVEPAFLPALQKDLLEVISKYIKIDANDIKVHLERDASMEVLEVKIELPDRL